MSEPKNDAAAIFEELDRSERSLAAVRSRALQSARSALLRGAAKHPQAAPRIEDVSDVAELLESVRPGAASLPTK
jgi:hypothetical protein